MARIFVKGAFKFVYCIGHISMYIHKFHYRHLINRQLMPWLGSLAYQLDCFTKHRWRLGLTNLMR